MYDIPSKLYHCSRCRKTPSMCMRTLILPMTCKLKNIYVQYHSFHSQTRGVDCWSNGVTSGELYMSWMDISERKVMSIKIETPHSPNFNTPTIQDAETKSIKSKFGSSILPQLSSFKASISTILAISTS